MRPIILATLALSACSLYSDGGDDAPPMATEVFPGSLNRDLDVLFVVDNSGSMAEEQVKLAREFPQFIDALDAVEGGRPNLHLGVISTNVGSGGFQTGGCSTVTRPFGDDGALLTNACTGLTGSFVSDVANPDGSRTRNYDGDLPALFSCMAQLGTAGCGFEQPLESMFRALQPDRNQGFLRPQAALAVIFLGDEDDCSAQGDTLFTDPQANLSSPLGPRTSFRCFEFGVECANDPEPRALGPRAGCAPRETSQLIHPVARYVDFVRGLKARPSDVMVAAITGHVDEAHRVVVGPDPNDASLPSVEPSCAGASGLGFPGFRLRAFAGAFPARSHVDSICSDDFTGVYAGIADRLRATLGVPCFHLDLADRDAEVAGVQPECTVTEFIASSDRTVIPACGAAGGVGCWSLISDPQLCPGSPANRVLHIDRGGAPVPGGLTVEASCVVNE